MKKGQSEIIGLAIVVIILIFALVFFVSFESDDNFETKIIRDNLRANSALNALMKVNADEKMQVKKLVINCLENVQRGDPCLNAKANMTYYLNNIFEGENYNLTVFDGNEIDIRLTPETGKDCDKSISASPYILQSNERVEFEICT